MTRQDDTRRALYSIGHTYNGGYFRLQDIHGTASCYRAGCRCHDCRAASALARRNARNRQHTPPDPNQPIAQDGRGRWRRGDYHIIPVFERADWMDTALCRGKDTRNWYPDKGGNNWTPYVQARDLCGRCPVNNDCLLYALRNKERFGLWGGIPERQRRPLENMTPEDAITAAEEIRTRWRPGQKHR